MKKQELVLPGYRVSDYMLVLNPPEEIRSKVVAIKEAFNKAFQVTTTASKPNLLLATFTQYEMMEERIVNKLKAVAMGQYPFKVEMRDFGSFPSHTIYISITSKVPIQTLVKQIRSNTQALMKLNSENKPYFAMEPHLTIARKLKPWQYEKSWLEYSTKHFTGRFIADSMVLLKRIDGDRGWVAVKRFEFQNLPVETRQGILF